MNVVDAIDSPVSEHYLSWVTNDEVDPEIFILFFFFLIGRTVGYKVLFSSPCQRQHELFPSLGVRRLSSINFSHFNLLL
jgi:hypothetical protein